MQFYAKYGIIKSKQKHIVAKLEELLPLCERLKYPCEDLSDLQQSKGDKHHGRSC